MIEPHFVGGFWLGAKLDRNSGGRTGLHVAIAVADYGDIAAESVDLAVFAGDTSLSQITRPGTDNPLMFTETMSITAVAFFTFDNPDQLRPTAVTVTLNNEYASWDISDQEPDQFLVS